MLAQVVSVPPLRLQLLIAAAGGARAEKPRERVRVGARAEPQPRDASGAAGQGVSTSGQARGNEGGMIVSFIGLVWAVGDALWQAAIEALSRLQN